MNRSVVVSAFMLVLLLALPVPGRAQDAVDQVRISTSDGNILVTLRDVSLRDYAFKLERALPDGVFILCDERSETRAEVDLRSEGGVYFLVIEGSRRMQLVAPWASVTNEHRNVLETPSAGRPSAGDEETIQDHLRMHLDMLRAQQTGL